MNQNSLRTVHTIIRLYKMRDDITTENKLPTITDVNIDKHAYLGLTSKYLIFLLPPRLIIL